MKGRRRRPVGSVILALISLPALARAEWLCWSSNEAQRIECALSDGSLQHSLVVSDGKPMGMAADHAGGTLFWTDRETERVMSVSLVGEVKVKTVVDLPPGAGLLGMAVASSVGKIYWVAADLGSIHRANFDGSGAETLPISAGSFFDVEVDEVSGTLYWTNDHEIWRGNLDGSSGKVIVGDADQPYYLALDLSAGKLYWTDFARSEIGRANLDGSNRENPGPVAGLADRPVGIAVDSASGKIYWTLEDGAVQRSDMDGSNVETLLLNLESPWDIALLGSIPAAGAIPAVSAWGTLALALSLLAAGTVASRQRHRRRPLVE